MHRTRLRAAGLAVAFCVLTSSAVVSAATIVVDNMDGAGEGFNDPSPRAPVGGNPGTTLGAQRLNAFTLAANIWGGIVNSAVTIRISATFDPLPCDGTSATLGQAAPLTVARDFSGAPAAGTWYAIALANSLAGSDLDPGNDDIVAQFNSVFGDGCAFPGGFYYGYDSNPPGMNDSDFVSVILHELCHGLGFGTLVDLTTGAKALGFNDTFELNLSDHSTGKQWPIMTDAERAASSIDTGDLFWTGPSVVADATFLTAGRDTGTGHVRMFAPNPLQGGSSVSHWDTVLSPDQLMEPVYTGPNHTPGLAVDLLVDIGWSVTSVSTTTVTTTTATTTTVPTIPGLDAYMCDKAATNVAAGGVKFDKTNLPTRSLQDAFGSLTCAFKKEDFVCPPELPATNPSIHQLRYQLVCPTPFTPTTVRVYDQFNPGGVNVKLVKRFDVMVPSGKIDLGATPPAPPQTVPPPPPALTVDHYLCYKVVGPNFSHTPIPVTVDDQFYPGGYPSLAVFKMTKVCTPVNKNNEDPSAPGHAGNYTCYQAKLPRGTVFNKRYVSTDNTNFGAQVLKVTNTGELCVPAARVP